MAPHPEDRKRRALRALLWLAALVVVLLLVYRLRAVLTPIFLAFIIAYATDPLVDRLEARGMKRWIGSVIVLSAILGTAGLFIVLLVPAFVVEIAAFAATLPDRMDHAVTELEPWVRSTFDVEIPRTFTEAMDRWGAQAQSIAPRLAGTAGSIVEGALGGVASLVGFLFQALLVPVFAYYLLVDFDRTVAKVRVLVPPRHRPRVGRVFTEIDRTMAGFFRGQLTVMLIQGILFATGLAILGVPLGIGIGLFTGLITFIPYVGLGTGFVVALLMALLHFDGWGTPIGVAVLYLGVSQLDAFVLTPRIVGGKVGLGPLAVIVALMACGELFGFLGILLAVPLAAVLKILVKEGIFSYLRSGSFGTSDERESAEKELEAIAAAPEPQPEPEAEGEKEEE